MSRKYTLDEIQKFAARKGGKCLSSRYNNSQSSLQWECAKGHQWKARAGPIINTSVWCPTCGGRPQLNISDMIALAKSKGGRCISKRYVNLATKLLWECSRGHRFQSVPSTIRHSGTWCPKCSGVARHSINDMKELAYVRGGKCLSRTYVNVNTPLLWECKLGHRWEAKPINVIHRETWCHICARYGKLTIEEMQQIAIARGGVCLSKRYINIGTKLKWKCIHGHIWNATPNDIKSNQSWCPHCAKRAPLTIERLQQAARRRGGECLSQRYEIGKALKWRCNNGHIWIAPANGILRGSWCPNCINAYCYTETRCRYIFEKLLKTSFPQNRSILNPLQLDGYSSKFQLAFEFNGRQHYDKDYYFHRFNKNSFRNIRCRDRKKVRLCRKLKIKLIVIPYYKATSDNELIMFIAGQLRKRHIGLRIIPLDIDLSRVPLNESKIDELDRIGALKGIKCLSKTYINSNAKLLFSCIAGHRWKARPIDVKCGRGCAKCSGKEKKTIQLVQDFAAKHGGKCLSTRYKNIGSPLLWECVRGHRWRTSFSNLYHGDRWCQQCPKEKVFEELCRIARSKGGQCLSKSYTNDDTKMEWRCAHGHTWQTRSRLIKDGYWCPMCNHNRLRLTIPQINEGIKHRGIRCLSIRYVNNEQKLRWQCPEGHIWRATTNMVRNNKSSGCPVCWKARRATYLAEKKIPRANYN